MWKRITRQECQRNVRFSRALTAPVSRVVARLACQRGRDAPNVTRPRFRASLNASPRPRRKGSSRRNCEPVQSLDARRRFGRPRGLDHPVVSNHPRRQAGIMALERLQGGLFDVVSHTRKISGFG